MIPDSEVEELTEDLSQERVVRFFKKHQNKLIYFHHVSKVPEVGVTALVNYEKGELKLVTTKVNNDLFWVVHTSKKVSVALLKTPAVLGSIKLKNVLNLASSLNQVNGVAVQCSSCYFTIGIKELREGLQSYA